MRIMCSYTVKWLQSCAKRREAVRSSREACEACREAAAKLPRSRVNQCEALSISVQPKHSLTMCGRPSMTREAL